MQWMNPQDITVISLSDKMAMARAAAAAAGPEAGAKIMQQVAEGWKKSVIDLIVAYCMLVTSAHQQVGAIGVYMQDASFCAFKWTPGKLCGNKQTAIAQALLMAFTSTPMPKLQSDWSHLFLKQDIARGASTFELNKHVWSDANGNGSVDNTPAEVSRIATAQEGKGAEHEELQAEAQRAGPKEFFETFQKELAEMVVYCDQHNKECDEGTSTKPFPNNMPMYCFNPKNLETSISV